MMEVGRVLFYLGVSILLAGFSVLADEKCKPYDKEVGPKLIEPLKKVINLSLGHINSFTSRKLFGAHFRAANGSIYEDFDLASEFNGIDSASLCIDSGPSKTVSTLEMKIGYHLRADFDKIALFIPGLPPIGATNASFLYTAETVSINVSVTREGDKCRVTLNSIQPTSLGTLHLELGSNESLLTSIAADIFRIVWVALWLISMPFYEGYTARNLLTHFGAQLLEGQQDRLCELIP